MKQLILILTFCLITSTIHAQDLHRSQEACEINVNDPDFFHVEKRDIINATVKIDFRDNSGVIGGCSGTLINRNTSNGDLGYYIITAAHCIDDVDFSATTNHFVFFNATNVVPQSNEGFSRSQSINLSDRDYEYILETGLRRVVCSYIISGR